MYKHREYIKEPNIQHSKTMLDSLFYCQKLEYTFHLAVNFAYAKSWIPPEVSTLLSSTLIYVYIYGSNYEVEFESKAEYHIGNNR